MGRSGHVGLDNVLDDCPADGTGPLLGSPLFDAALVASAHVAALIEDTVDWTLKTNGTILAGWSLLVVSVVRC